MIEQQAPGKGPTASTIDTPIMARHLSFASDMDIALTMTESTELDSLEKVIEAGLATFVEVGNALIRIRDGRLYRQTHDSFEAYLRDRFDLSRGRGYQLIDAARVSTMVDSLGAPMPTSERQARELIGLEPDVAATVMMTATSGGTKTATAKTIATARDEVVDRPKRVTPRGRLFNTGGKRRARIDPDHVVETVVMHAESWATSSVAEVVHFEDLDVDRLEDWANRLGPAVRALKTLQAQLRNERAVRASTGGEDQ